jgi:DNA-binding Lrp family transcriptional regulator
MLLDCRIGTDEIVLNELKKVTKVAYAYRVIGYHDIIVKVEASSEEELRRAISSQIRRLENVISSVTMIVVEK